ncbi:MAG: APH(3') family aminoglycoside O-phosphotransferase [Bdellovibrionota bacterium]
MAIPKEISKLIQPASLLSIEIGKSKSEVFRVDLLDGGQGFLKQSSSANVLAEIQQEMAVLRWLGRNLPVPQAICFIQANGSGYFLLSAIRGQNLAEAKGLSPEDCLRLGASFLRKIHSVSIVNCPFLRNLETTLALAKKNMAANLVDESDFDEAHLGKSAQEVYRHLLGTITKGKEDLVFTHGDYCLPNIIVDSGVVSGVVDLSRAGTADRHQDIALFLRSYESNTGVKPDTQIFLREYGLIKNLSEEKLAFYRTLDEFF